MEKEILRAEGVCAVVTLSGGCVVGEAWRDSERAWLDSAFPSQGEFRGSRLTGGAGDRGQDAREPSPLASLALDARKRLLSLNAGGEHEGPALEVRGKRLALAASTPNTLVYLSRGHALGAVYAARGVLEYFVLGRDMRKEAVRGVLVALEGVEAVR